MDIVNAGCQTTESTHSTYLYAFAYEWPTDPIGWMSYCTPSNDAVVHPYGFACADAIYRYARTPGRTLHICTDVPWYGCADALVNSLLHWTFYDRIRIRTAVRRCACGSGAPNGPAPRTSSCTHRTDTDRKRQQALRCLIHWPRWWMQHCRHSSVWCCSIWRATSYDWYGHFYYRNKYCTGHICIEVWFVGDVFAVTSATVAIAIDHWSRWFPATPSSSQHCPIVAWSSMSGCIIAVRWMWSASVVIAHFHRCWCTLARLLCAPIASSMVPKCSKPFCENLHQLKRAIIRSRWLYSTYEDIYFFLILHSKWEKLNVNRAGVVWWQPLLIWMEWF